MYLATAYNPETRSVLSYKIGKQMTSELALVPILDALNHFRNPHIIHSDMGSQYTSFNFEDVLKANKIKHSYSLKEYPYDNGRIEAFHSILKREMIYQRKFRSIDEIELAVG
ncbi:DDE-type integrase/transposase/recombinase [Weissella oryzae]|uniref:DDE-type integrase/transposase/recombinase n=1 Tax=Weissella oryzae TaxID=1129792 RepID=UPI0011A54F2B